METREESRRAGGVQDDSFPDFSGEGYTLGQVLTRKIRASAAGGKMSEKRDFIFTKTWS